LQAADLVDFDADAQLVTACRPPISLIRKKNTRPTISCVRQSWCLYDGNTPLARRPPHQAAAVKTGNRVRRSCASKHEPSHRETSAQTAGQRIWRTAGAYVFGEVRVATRASLTFTALLGPRSSDVVMAKFSGHAVTFRSSLTVCADTPRVLSASTRIISGKPPRAMRGAVMLLGFIALGPIVRPC
jgi:hypothetical protein